MNDWIKNESEKSGREITERKQKEYLISVSNYWADLRQQIERDVVEINNDPVFRQAFNESLIIEKTDNGGFRIKKTSFPAAFYVTVENGGDEIRVAVEYGLSGLSDWSESEERLRVELKGKHVCLSNYNESFIVPEQASQYILRTVVRAKDDSLRFFAERG
jgi:hypothetical protein